MVSLEEQRMIVLAHAKTKLEREKDLDDANAAYYDAARVFFELADKDNKKAIERTEDELRFIGSSDKKTESALTKRLATLKKPITKLDICDTACAERKFERLYDWSKVPQEVLEKARDARITSLEAELAELKDAKNKLVYAKVEDFSDSEIKAQVKAMYPDKKVQDKAMEAYERQGNIKSLGLRGTIN